MNEVTFIFEDGNLDIEKGVYLKVEDKDDGYIRIEAEKTVYVDNRAPYPSPENGYNAAYYDKVDKWKEKNVKGFLKIPMSHIVDIEFVTEETLVQRTKGGRKGTLIGATLGGGAVLALLAPVIAVPGSIAAVGGSIAYLTGAGAVAGGSSGGILGVISNFTKKKVKQNHFIIAYLDESAPEDLKMIILNANTSLGNSFVRDKMAFAEMLISQVSRTKKAYLVERFIKKLNGEEVTDTETDFLMKVSPAHVIFKIDGNGVTATGKVGMGKVNRGDYVWVCSPDYAKMKKAKIITIKKSKDEVDSISYGDNASVLLEGITKTDIGQDYILTTNVIDTTGNGSIGWGAISFYADVKVFDENGLDDPLLDGVPYLFTFGSHIIEGKMEFPPALKDGWLEHGAEDVVRVTLENPIITCLDVPLYD